MKKCQLMNSTLIELFFSFQVKLLSNSLYFTYEMFSFSWKIENNFENSLAIMNHQLWIIKDFFFLSMSGLFFQSVFNVRSDFF